MGEKRMKIRARFHNLNILTNIEEIKSDKIGNFISMKGVVLKTMPVRLLTIRMTFKCFECIKNLTYKITFHTFTYCWIMQYGNDNLMLV